MDKLGEYKIKFTDDLKGYELTREGKQLKIAIRTIWVKGIREERATDEYFLIDGVFEYKLKKVKRKVLDDPNWDWEYYGWSYQKGRFIIEHHFDEDKMIIRSSKNGM